MALFITQVQVCLLWKFFFFLHIFASKRDSYYVHLKMLTPYIMMDIVLLWKWSDKILKDTEKSQLQKIFHSKLRILHPVLGEMVVDGLLLRSCQRTLTILWSSKLFSRSSIYPKLFFWQLYKGTSHHTYTPLSLIFFLYCRAFSLQFLTWGTVAKSEEEEKNNRCADTIFMAFCCSDGAIDGRGWSQVTGRVDFPL